MKMCEDVEAEVHAVQFFCVSLQQDAAGPIAWEAEWNIAGLKAAKRKKYFCCRKSNPGQLDRSHSS
jgi:hypothetical protein